MIGADGAELPQYIVRERDEYAEALVGGQLFVDQLIERGILQVANLRDGRSSCLVRGAWSD